MANPPKKKGTGGETELMRLLNTRTNPRTFVRTAPTMSFDLCSPGGWPAPVEVLATRPDKGQWLVTLRLEDFASLLNIADLFDPRPESRYEIHVEVKRYKRFSLHSIYEGKFGKRGQSRVQT